MSIVSETNMVNTAEKISHAETKPSVGVFFRMG